MIAIAEKMTAQNQKIIEYFKALEIEKMIKENGRNIHFLAVVADGQKTVLRGLREVIYKENPSTTTWYKPNMDRIHFIKFGGKLCHQ